MILNEKPVIADSLWTATANPAPFCPPLTSEIDTDVVVIGGGYAGLSAALHLAEAGVAVTVLESETPGWGASGRNGGQINPGLKTEPDQIEADLGEDVGARLVALSGMAADLVFSLIDRHAIRCDAVRSGWIRAAHSGTAMARLIDSAAQWRRRGAPVMVLDRAELAILMGSDAYVGGLVDQRGGNLHPLNYALGLADAAIAAGARVHGQSRAIELRDTGSAVVVLTQQGRVRARRALVCTNGYSGDLLPAIARTVVPVRSIQVATAPLPAELADTILPGRQAPSDTRRMLLYFRKDAANRFIMGGRGAYGDAATRRLLAALRRSSLELFPQLGPARWQFAWGGFVAMTADHYPHLNPVGDRIVAGLGFNGRGVAMATVMGRVMADWAQGVPSAELGIPLTPPRPIPFHALRRLGAAAAIARGQLMDLLES